jgi:hypothetical protein
MKKMRSDGLAIMTVMIALIIGVWTGMALATAEEDMFTATTQPDALILLDLSGSMASTPSGGNKYGATSACTADTVKCAGVSTSYPYSSNTAGTPEAPILYCRGATDRSNYPYGADTTCAPNTAATACAATAPAYPYAHDSTLAPNTSKCTGTGCSGGYCSTSKTGCSTLRGTLCSGGFCKTSQTGCNVNCNYDCTGGFCKTAKPGCDIYVGGSCSGGFCVTDVQSDCSVDCSKLAVAKRSIFSFLDDNNDGQITGADKTSLGVRIGYMRWYNCSNSTSSSLGEEGRASPTYN